MTGYDPVADPYRYEGTTILRNLQGIRSAPDLERFEDAMARQRANEPPPAGRFGVAHYRAVHRHLFQDVYAWAGKFRTVRVSKGANAFCYPEHIEREMRSLFLSLGEQRQLRGLARKDFVHSATAFLATLNAIHPFREGNGRTQLSFLMLLAERAGHPMDIDRLEPRLFLAAMIASFSGDERPLAAELAKLTEAS
ncbi:MAG: Fic family protein [Rhizomicrobium sp.]